MLLIHKFFLFFIIINDNNLENNIIRDDNMGAAGENSLFPMPLLIKRNVDLEFLNILRFGVNKFVKIFIIVNK